MAHTGERASKTKPEGEFASERALSLIHSPSPQVSRLSHHYCVRLARLAQATQPPFLANPTMLSVIPGAISYHGPYLEIFVPVVGRHPCHGHNYDPICAAR